LKVESKYKYSCTLQAARKYKYSLKKIQNTVDGGKSKVSSKCRVE